jgi:hypothetical protein
VDRPRSGRPPKVTCALEKPLNRLIDQAPLQHGSLYSPWSCRELATVLARETGVQLGRESVRSVLKKTRCAALAPPADLLPTRLLSPLALLHWLRESTGPAAARSLCSMQTKRSSGALPCPVLGGGAQRCALASPHVP